MKLTDATVPADPLCPPASKDKFILLCFSHLRWAFVYQRPQHLMSRFARNHRVIFWEEPIVGDFDAPRLESEACLESGVRVVRPLLPERLSSSEQESQLKILLDGLMADCSEKVVRWYYTPMMLPFSQHILAKAVVYDCMDELANFKFAPPELVQLEGRLMAEADLVFTGGFSLYEAKRKQHPAVHPYPSSVDCSHFGQARSGCAEPADQAAIPGLRLGFFGVIDERMDLDLLARVADARPDWSLVLVGPVVKIDPADLPQRPNIHYLGGKSYDALPAYLSGWNVALMPFAINESTKFISPTKTPEYLAGGKPVVSTPITDVIRHYGELAGVFIADDADLFIEGCERALALPVHGQWLEEADQILGNLSWDITQSRMAGLIAETLASKRRIFFPTTPRRERFDYLVVGAGFAGAVLAERLANENGSRVLVIDKRDHIAGNAYDRRDAAGVLFHQYGPHIFHTNSDEIFAYLSRFTSWRPYEHRVLASVRDQLVPIPINRTTINKLYGLDLSTEAEAAAWLASRSEPVEPIRTSEDVVVSAVGRELYELFFQGYTRKQWGIDPSGLDKAVTSRIPTRTSTDDRYFGDKYQAMPLHGYTAMFESMLDHPLIEVRLNTSWQEIKDKIDVGHVVYTGPIDEYFEHRFGRLPYRSLRFEHGTLDQEWLQPVGVVNYPDPSTPFTRITEYKHLTGQILPVTSVTLEYPSAEGDPYYPMPTAQAQALYKKYERLADLTANVTFVGRLATYRYYNMDQVVGQALAAFRKMKDRPLASNATNDAGLGLVKLTG